MAAIRRDDVAQREHLRDERDAQVGRQVGDDGLTPSQALDSVRVRVHLYERELRAKPVSSGHFPESPRLHGATPSSAPGEVTDGARYCRTTATCVWGVSDPSFQCAEPRQEGGRGGRSRPRCPLTAADSRADCDTGGTERRPLSPHPTADCEGHRGIRRAQRLSGLRRARAGQQRAERGNTAPASVFPLSSRRSGWNWRNQG
jgi:hypothetical protein